MVTNFETNTTAEKNNFINRRSAGSGDQQHFGHSPFHSFWMGGFECSDKLNAFGHRVDLINESGHLQLLEQDYCNLATFNMKTVREGIRWSQVEKVPYTYDWSAVIKMMDCAKKCNVQQLWDLCHFGFPDDLTPLHPMFPRRFAALCRAFIQFYRSIDPVGTLIVTPINEVSFLSWLGGDANGTVPYCNGQGWRVKYCLMKAFIEGVEAIKEIDPSVRILTTEPLVNVVPPANADEHQISRAAAIHDDQFQVTDMLAGKICPELRGRPEYLDIVGYNYYYNNQWSVDPYEVLGWANELEDKRFVSLSDLLRQAYQRYNRPFVITETSHPEEDRPIWIDMIADECKTLLDEGFPLWGVCWYPVTDRPDWDDLSTWHQSGLWDGAFSPDHLKRVLNIPTAQALMEAQALLSKYTGVVQKAMIQEVVVRRLAGVATNDMERILQASEY